MNPLPSIALAATLLAPLATAEEITYSDETGPAWPVADVLTIPRFDPGLGCLIAVTITAEASFDASFGVENLDHGVEWFAVDGDANVTIQRPDASTLVAAEAMIHIEGSLGPFDGTIDFDGPSGQTIPFETSDSLTQIVPPLSPALEGFTGTGTLSYPVTGSGDVTVSGPSNFVFQVSYSGAASISVTYTYTPSPTCPSQVLYSDTVPLQLTNFVDDVTLPRFDPTLGCLLGAVVTMDVHLEGAVGVESLDSQATTSTVEWSADVDLLRPDDSPLVELAPALVFTVDLEPFDGTIDFMGPSGAWFPGLVLDESAGLVVGTGPDLALFTGTTPLTLPVRAVGTSQITGASGPAFATEQAVAVTVTVVYSYAPATRYCDALPNSTGFPAATTWLGSTSVSDNALILVAGPLPPGQNGLFVYSPDRTQVPLGNGNLCVGDATLGFVLRLPFEHSGAAGVLVHALDLASPPDPLGQITPGSTWNFTCWHRDVPAGGAGFNFSDGLSILFCP